jgi:TadE-like protein
VLRQVTSVFRTTCTLVTKSTIWLSANWLPRMRRKLQRAVYPGRTTLARLRHNVTRRWGGHPFHPRTVVGMGNPQTVPVPVRVTERGQALIEVAFVLPIILVFLLVIVDFGFAFDRRQVIQHGVAEGARSAAVGNDIATVTNDTNDQSGGILSNIQVCYRDVNTNNPLGGAGDSVRVSGEYTYNFMIGSGAFLSGAIPGIKMTPSSEMRLQKSVPNASACP